MVKPVTAAQPKFYTLTLSQPEVDLIGAALGEIPLKTGIALWMKIKAVVVQQQVEAAKTQPAPVTGASSADGNTPGSGAS